MSLNRIVSPVDDRGKCTVNIGISEAEAALERGLRYYALTAQQEFFSESPQRQAEWRGRHRENRGPGEGAPQC